MSTPEVTQMLRRLSRTRPVSPPRRVKPPALTKPPATRTRPQDMARKTERASLIAALEATRQLRSPVPSPQLQHSGSDFLTASSETHVGGNTPRPPPPPAEMDPSSGTLSPLPQFDPNIDYDTAPPPPDEDFMSNVVRRDVKILFRSHVRSVIDAARVKSKPNQLDTVSGYKDRADRWSAAGKVFALHSMRTAWLQESYATFRSPAVIEGVNRIFGKKRKSEDQEAGALRKQWGKHLQARYNQLNIAFQHTQRALELHEAGYLEESAFNFSLAIAEYFRRSSTDCNKALKHDALCDQMLYRFCDVCSQIEGVLCAYVSVAMNRYTRAASLKKLLVDSKATSFSAIEDADNEDANKDIQIQTLQIALNDDLLHAEENLNRWIKVRKKVQEQKELIAWTKANKAQLKHDLHDFMRNDEHGRNEHSPPRPIAVLVTEVLMQSIELSPSASLSQSLVEHCREWMDFSLTVAQVDPHDKYRIVPMTAKHLANRQVTVTLSDFAQTVKDRPVTDNDKRALTSQVQTWDAIADSLPDLITCSEVLRYESYRFRNYPGSSSNFVQSLKEKVEMFNIVTFCLSFYVDICLDWYVVANWGPGRSDLRKGFVSAIVFSLVATCLLDWSTTEAISIDFANENHGRKRSCCGGSAERPESLFVRLLMNLTFTRVMYETYIAMVYYKAKRKPRAAWYQVKIAQIFQQLPQSFIQMFRLVSLYYDGLPAVRTVTALSFALSCAAVCNTLTSSGVNVSIIWRIPFTVFCFFQLILRLSTISMLLILLMEHCENGMGLGIEVDCQTSMVYTASLFVFSSYQLLVGMLFHVVHLQGHLGGSLVNCTRTLKCLTRSAHKKRAEIRHAVEKEKVMTSQDLKRYTSLRYDTMRIVNQNVGSWILGFINLMIPYEAAPFTVLKNMTGHVPRVYFFIFRLSEVLIVAWWFDHQLTARNLKTEFDMDAAFISAFSSTVILYLICVLVPHGLNDDLSPAASRMVSTSGLKKYGVTRAITTSDANAKKSLLRKSRVSRSETTMTCLLLAMLIVSYVLLYTSFEFTTFITCAKYKASCASGSTCVEFRKAKLQVQLANAVRDTNQTNIFCVSNMSGGSGFAMLPIAT